MRLRAKFEDGTVFVLGRELAITDWVVETFSEEETRFLLNEGYTIDEGSDVVTPKLIRKQFPGLKPMSWPSSNGLKIMSPKPRLSMMIYLLQTGLGGTESRLYQLATKLDYDIHICWLKGEESEITQRFMKLKRVIGGGPLHTKKDFVGYCVKNDIDIIFFYGTTIPASAFKQSGVPRPVMIFNLTTQIRDTSIDHYLAGKKQIDAAIAVSPKIKEAIGDDSKVVAIPSGVDTDKFKPKKKKKHKAFKLGYLGRFAEKKGIELIPAALKDLKNIELHMAASDWKGNPRYELTKKKCKEYGIKFVFHQYRTDPWNFIDEMDAMVLMSRREGLPMAVLEAAMCGVATIATPVGGLPYYFKHKENIWFLGERSTKALRSVLVELRKYPKKLAGISSRARKLARKKFTLDRMVKEYKAIFDKQVLKRTRLCKEVGVRRNTGAGDIIMAEVPVRRLRKIYPNAHIHFECDNRFEAIGLVVGDSRVVRHRKIPVHTNLLYKPTDKAHAIKQFLKQTNMSLSSVKLERRYPDLRHISKIKKDRQIAIHASTDSKEKEWSRARWQRLINALAGKGYAVSQIDDGVPFENVELVRSPNFFEYVRTIGRFRLLITIDTVAQHASASLDVPTVVIWGKASHPGLTGYRHQRNVVSAKDCSCWVTVKEEMRRKDCPGGCMEAISTRCVLKNVMEVAKEIELK